MQRRDFVKAIVAASVTARTMLGQQAPTTSSTVTPSTPPATPVQAPTAPGPVPWMRGLEDVKPLSMHSIVPDAIAQTDSHFFSDQQFATLRHLSDILLPPWKTYPGALEVGTPEFLDFLIGRSPEDRQHMYRDGLDRLEAEANKQSNVPFAALTAAQADTILRPHLRTWMNDHPPAESFEYFVNIVHADVRTATINSQAWSEAAVAAGKKADEGLYWFPIDPDMRRDETSAPHRPTGSSRRA